ncbi:FG-GAP repeat domain-containing protein [Crateriforma spongiae]|uniref:FG-GAP repeat domain-containing protein n=1 Tax=Crateriforma spongiae TaxID=2724528 RepID=UPI001446B6BD|nr:VCBS repeat-containing protein [Crateriforma spongiae]
MLNRITTQLCVVSLLVLCQSTLTFGDQTTPQFQWSVQTVDEIQIGYGVQLEDVNGDGKRDIVLADKRTIQWYESPSWTKHVIAEDLTKRDNVCVTARDIDGDGRCEIAIGGQWNYRESVKDGAVFYLVPPQDQTQLWEPVRLHNDPSTHRMHWVRTGTDQYRLIVKPLRGKGSVDGDGPALRILEYTMPQDPREPWGYSVVSESLHLSHNFHRVNWDDDPEEELIVAAKEGVWHFDRGEDGWTPRQLTEDFAGEIRDGRLPNGKRFIVTIEPKHGSTSAVYVQSDDGGLWQRQAILDQALKDGHALACADFLGVGSDQIVVGWRAMNDPGVPGIKLFVPAADDGSRWTEQRLSAEEIAVEDLKVADMNDDGKVDIVAAARQTKNLVILFNETP